MFGLLSGVHSDREPKHVMLKQSYIVLATAEIGQALVCYMSENFLAKFNGSRLQFNFLFNFNMN